MLGGTGGLAPACPPEGTPGVPAKEIIMTDDTKLPPPKDDERREKADKAATEPGPSDKQGDTQKPGLTEQQPT